MRGTLFRAEIWQTILVTAVLIFAVSTFGLLETTSRAKAVRQMMNEADSTFGEVVMADGLHGGEYDAMMKPYAWGPIRWPMYDFVWLGVVNLGKKGYTAELTARICSYLNWLLLSVIGIFVARKKARKYTTDAQRELNDDKNSGAIVRKDTKDTKGKRRSVEYVISWGDYGCRECVILMLAMVPGRLFFGNPNWTVLLAAIYLTLRNLQRYLGLGGVFVKMPKAERQRKKSRRFGIGRRGSDEPRPQMKPRYVATGPLQEVVFSVLHRLNVDGF